MTAVAKLRPAALGEQLDALGAQISALDKKRKDHEAAAKELKEQIEELENQVLELMDAAETTIAAGAKYKFQVEESELPRVVDWDAFYRYLAKTKYFHLLERRPAVLACRELWSQGKLIPGTEKFLKRKPKLRSV